MASIKWILLLALLGYGGMLTMLYLGQRALMYFPDPVRRSPASVGLARGEEALLQTSDGERVLAWHVPPRGDRPVVLYFQGNGGGLDLRADRFRRLVADGTGLLALNYRGYGGSSDKPTEPGLLRDAAALYDFAAARYPAGRLVLWGESLGTGVAVGLGAERPVGRVLLESPFTSTADVAAAIYWFVPVRWLMHDQFRSDLRVGKITAPVLVVHGMRDGVVPFAFGERLFEMIRAPKHLMPLPGAGHNDHDSFGMVEKVRPFLDGAI
jgi:fermentation-respiration switch protein FrsA (DUF1100 family)